MLGGLTARLVLAFVLAAAVFLVWPGIDLWFSGLFHDGEDFADADALEMSRHLIWSASIMVALGALALWLAWLPLGRKASLPGRLWGWIVLTYLLGPGILVNGILKEHWGRARPAQVFRGDAEFSRPFVIVDECARNCSFVSGEASAATALAIVIGALAWPSLGGRGRRRTVAVLGAVALLAGLMRVATGRHFLSDVVFASFLTALVALALWHGLRVAAARDALSVRAVRSDVRTLAGQLSRRWRQILD